MEIHTYSPLVAEHRARLLEARLTTLPRPNATNAPYKTLELYLPRDDDGCCRNAQDSTRTLHFEL